MPNVTEVYQRRAAERARLMDVPTTQPEAAELLVTMLEMHDRYGVGTCFSFHRLNEFARAACDEWRAALRLLGRDDVSVMRLDGSMGAAARDGVLRPLRDGGGDAKSLRIVANARLLIEGVDVPTVDLVSLAEPMHSPVEILQAAARAQRPAAGKECGYVLVPVRGAHANGTLLGDADSTVHDVLLAFRNEDAELATALQELSSLREELGRELRYDDWPRALRDRVALLGSGEALERELEVIERSVNAVVVELGAAQWSTVGEKVGWLCAMHPEQKPAQTKVDVPSELLPPGAPPATFNAGTFLTGICNNWLEGTVATRLSEEEKARVEGLAWFAGWLEGMREFRASRQR